MNARSFYTTDVYVEHYLGNRWPVAIWAAVLRQAVADILDGPAAFEYRGADLHEAERMRCEYRAAAEHWVEDDTNEPRRFVWVCDLLGLEPEAVRRAINERRNPL